MMRIWLVRTLGLKGSFQWAIRQMGKGKIVTRKSNSTLRYQLDTDNSRRILSTFPQHVPGTVGCLNYNWQSAIFEFGYTQATDWCLVPDYKTICKNF